jgi:hypothetical protein
MRVDEKARLQEQRKQLLSEMRSMSEAPRMAASCLTSRRATNS